MNMSELTGKKIALVSTVPYFMVSQLSNQIKYFVSLGMQVTIITSSGKELSQLPLNNQIKVVILEIPRQIAILNDFKALVKLVFLLKKESFDIVHSFTPKAGFLCALAGKITRVPVRLHTFTGQAWATRRGLIRKIMRFSDKLVVRLMNHCYADSFSQRTFLIREGIAHSEDVTVIGKGSLGGVDLKRFSPEIFGSREKGRIKSELGLSESSFIFTYIGRITKDKGIDELLEAFGRLQHQGLESELLLIGPVDSDGEQAMYRAKEMKYIHYIGFQEYPEHFLSISDVLCLPSYREGFGTVVIEAGAMGVPCIGTNIPGLIDAIEDGVTGTLVPVRDVNELCSVMERLANDRGLCQKMGEQANLRVKQLYDSEYVNTELVQEYICQMQKVV